MREVKKPKIDYHRFMVKKKKTHKNIWRYWRPIYRFTWAFIQRTSYAHFCQHLKGEGKTVLDIGTGTGVYIKNLPRQHKYFFSDLDPKSLEKSKKQALAHLDPGRYSFIVGDALHALDAIESADVISLIHVISVVPDPHKVLHAAIDKLAPGGELVVYISALSKKIPTNLQDRFTGLGFRTLKLEELQIKWEVSRVSAFNECYRYRKRSN